METSSPFSYLADTLLPHDVKVHIARELYDDSTLSHTPSDNAALVSLSMSSRAWRFASLPFLYYHCRIGGKGNFAIENWLTLILPQHGRFTRSIDIALCWTHPNHLPERERESMQLGQDSITNQWEHTREGLVAQLVSNLPNLLEARLTMQKCIGSYESAQCSCNNRFGAVVQAFEHRRFQSMAFHGIATTFCPRLARSIFTPSTDSLLSVHFSDDIDGNPSISQPFERICRLPVLARMTFATGSFYAHEIEAMPWASPLEAITITNETIDRIVQPLSVTRLSGLLERFSSTLSSLTLHDVAIELQAGTHNQLPGFPNLIYLTLQSTRESTFRTLELLEGHTFELLSISVAPAVKPNLLLGALSKGAFPGLKHVEIHFSPKEHWSSSACWDSNTRAAIQSICDRRHIVLTMVESRHQKASSAKVRVRRRVPTQL